MYISTLKAISPLDGRYHKKVNFISNYCSEMSLFKLRIKVEIKWLQKLSCNMYIKELPKLDKNTEKYLNNILNDISLEDIKRIKYIESLTKHDVKAVEYFLKEKFSLHPKLKKIKEFLHFACTSDDINNLSYALMMINIRDDIIIPYWKKIINFMERMAKNYKIIPMLSRTHGRPASSSTLGKEIVNFIYRMQRQLSQLKKVEILGKINGTVGNYNAHKISYPNIDWIAFSKEFVNSLGITWNPYTTQIEPHDYIVEFLHCIIRFNSILINVNIDFWNYILLGYFNIKYSIKETGSSVMPHKVNPIFFENSEANLGLSNSVMMYISSKLQISRWQRDLTDSTLLRNIGSCIGYSIIAYKNILNGLNKLTLNREKLLSKLNEHWEILSEPIQTIMRKNGIFNSYEKLKVFSMGKKLNSQEIKHFIKGLSITEQDKKVLFNLTPETYLGYAVDMVDNYFLKK